MPLTYIRLTAKGWFLVLPKFINRFALLVFLNLICPALQSQTTIISDLSWKVGLSQIGPFTEPVFDVSNCVDEAYIDAQCGTSYESPMLDVHFAGCGCMTPIWPMASPTDCVFPPSFDYWFYKEFTYNGPANEPANVTIQGDQDFDLYINGTLIGVSDISQWHTSFNFNVTSQIVNGTNTILVRSKNVGGGGCFNYAFVAFCLQIGTGTVTPPFVAMPDDSICANTSLGLQASPGALSYQWEPNPTLSATNVPNPVASPISTTTYTVTITLACGVTKVDDIAVTVLNPVALAGPNAFLPCNNSGNSVFLDGTGSSQAPGTSYLWTTPNGQIVSGENTTTPSVSAAGTYILTVSQASSTGICLSTDTVLVTASGSPLAMATALGPIDCNTGLAAVTGAGSSSGPDITYEWNTTNGQLVSGQNSLVAQVSSSGTYTLTVMDSSNGCTSSASVMVVQDTQNPLAFITTPPLLTCQQTQAILDANGSSTGQPFEYFWETPNGNIIGGTTTLQATIDEPGTYFFIVSNNQNGCMDTAFVLVAQDTLSPSVEAGPSFELNCHLTEAMLSGSTDLSPGGFAADWTTLDGNILSGSQTLTPLVNAPGTYQLVVTNLATGCSAIGQVTLTENILESFFFEITEPTCLQPTGSLNFTGVTGGNPPFEYSINGGVDFSGQTDFIGLTHGPYSLVVQDANGCELEEIVEIPDVPGVPILLEAQVTVCLGESYQLLPQTTLPPGQIASIIWTPDTGLSCSDCLTPVVAPLLEPVTYQVRITSVDGCEGVASTILFLQKNVDVYVPNAFSPNEDGFNDLFMIFAGKKGIVQISEFKVFGRWGGLVFQQSDFPPNDPKYGWDGTFLGEQLNTDVFAWFAEVELLDGTSLLLEGDVSLVK